MGRTTDCLLDPSVREVDNGSVSCDSKPRRPRWRSWRLTVLVSTVTAAAVLLVNVGILIWSSTSFESEGNFITIFEGSCETTKTVSTWSHLAINILSTALLAASNGCAQLLAAPTRAEIDKAHAKGLWVDIGIKSVANVVDFIDKRRAVLYALLVISSIPLHLFYNSVIYSTIGANDYRASLVTNDFLRGGWWDHEAAGISAGAVDVVHYMQDNIESLVKLDNSDCLRTYTSKYQTDWGNVLAVTSLTRNDSVLEVWQNYAGDVDGRQWFCDEKKSWHQIVYSSQWRSYYHCDVQSLVDHADNWTLRFSAYDPEMGIVKSFHAPIEYCLATETRSHCTIRTSTILLAIVVACNTVKFLCLMATLLLRSFEPLATVGDALSSFIQEPDPTTSHSNLSTSKFDPAFKCQKRRWVSGVNSTRAVLCLLLCTGVWLGGLGLLLYHGIKDRRGLPGWSKLWSLATAPPTLLWSLSEYYATANTNAYLLQNVLLVNLPQLLLSLLYVYANKLLTSMVSAHEYANFAAVRKSLRVSDPDRAQRSTFWLQLPYRYALPFAVAMTLVHWFMSRGLFIFELVDYDNTEGRNLQPGLDVIAIGFSPLWIVLALILVGLVIFVLAGLSIRRLNPGIPIAFGGCSNSLALSAAAHPASEEEDAAFLPLQYGIVLRGEEGECGERIGFSSKEVGPLILGNTYAQGG